MKKKIRYDEDMPSNNARMIKDFLPPPEKLVMPNDKVKITLVIDLPSVEFFKAHAKRLGTKYQRMMREVLKRYAQMHSRRPT
jgi:hypothetical protein